MWRWLENLLYGSPTQLVAVPPVQEIAATKALIEAKGRSSLIFDSHIMTEASGGGSGRGPQAVSLAWDENRAYGISLAPQSWLGMTPRERKETLLSIFLANPWASNCIDTIALYITSGGYTIEPRVEKPDERQRDEIEQFLRRINEDWDFNQYVYDALTDEMIFGEAFSEFTMKQGKPYQLFSIDCLTMDTEHDRYGRVTKYKQQLTLTSEVNELDPRTIIRWWNPHKRAKVDPFSPLERIQDAILLDKKMVNWQTTFFQKGAKFNYYFKGLGDQDEADRFLTWAKANLFGEKNAQTPPVLWGNAEIAPLGNAGPLDMSFDKGLDRMLTIVLSAFHVPPSIACIAESGNRLTDMSDGQRKILQYIACDPRRHRFFEKFNYRLIHPFFGDHYYVSSRYADFRDDKSLAEVADIRVKNGTLTQNEVRQEMGKEAYKKGGDVPVIITTREVTPVPRLDDLEDEQRQTAQVTLDTAKANADLAQTKAKQAKEPPPPAPAPLQKVQQNGASNKTKQPTQKDDEKQEESHEEQETPAQNHETDALTTGPDQNQGTGALSPVQDDTVSSERSNTLDESSNANVADQQKAELTAWIANLFSTMKERGGSLSPTPATALATYAFNDQEQESLAHKLAEVHQAAQAFAYHRDMTAVGLAQEGIIDKFKGALVWAMEQVRSVCKTFAEQLQSFLSTLSSDVNNIVDEISRWIDRYVAYKAQQIANVAWGSGVNAGSMAAIKAILEAAIETLNIRVRVTPSESSGDFCKDWAGKSVPIKEADTLPVFPAHPGCIHNLEVYVGGSDA